MVIPVSFYKQGISGGNGAQHFDDSASIPDPDPKGLRVLSIRIRSGASIDSIQFVYLANGGQELPAPHHGGQGGNEAEFGLAEGEHLIRLEGSFGNYVDFLRLTTDKGRVKEFGMYHVPNTPGIAQAAPPPGSPLPFQTNYFGYAAPPGYEIFAIWGNAHSYLDAIGVVYRTILSAASNEERDQKGRPKMARPDSPTQ